MKKLILFLLLSFTILGTSAQTTQINPYHTAIGMKFWPTAISFKQFIAHEKALEVDAFLLHDGPRFSALYEIYGNVQRTNLYWYYGFGGHYGRRYSDRAISSGIDATAGLDYKFKKAPLNLSLAFQPAIEFTSGPFISGWGGLGIRYVIR